MYRDLKTCERVRKNRRSVLVRIDQLHGSYQGGANTGDHLQGSQRRRQTKGFDGPNYHEEYVARNTISCHQKTDRERDGQSRRR